MEGISGVVLVVDDSAFVLKSVARILSRTFEQVLTAASPDEAEVQLAGQAVTHVVCDQVLGRDLPRGTDLVPEWRTRFPSIRRAIILTGSPLAEVPTVDGVDAILGKPGSANEIFEGLGIVR